MTLRIPQSSNTRDPYNSTASSANIDTLISSLSSLLLGANTNNEQMANSLKNAVKEGIIEANKHDVRINDAEEREAERRHKELMHHLSRIASLGGGEKTIGKDGAAKDNKDGFGILDALKWGGVAAGAMGLVANIDNLVKVFGETSKTVGDVSNQVLGMVGSVKSFGETMGKLVDNAFSKEGAIGAILGAFIPGGVIAKAFFALLGGATTGSIFGPGTSNTPGSNPSTTGGPISSNGVPAATGTPSGGFMQSIRNTDINNNAGMASAAAFGLGGGGLVARGARALGTYVAVDAMVPELDENGQPKETLLSRSKRALNPYNDDGSLNQNVTQGAVVGGAAGIMAAKVVPKNKVGLGMAAFAGGMGYIFGNSETRQGAVELIKDNLPDVSSLLGISAPKNVYNTKLKEYEDEIAKLEKERDAVFTFTPEQAREVNTPEKWSKKREELTGVQTKLKEKIAKLKAEKEEFKTKTDTGNRDILKGALKDVPVNPNAGESSYFSMEAGASVALGAVIGAFGGPAGAAVGAVGGAISSSSFVFAINSVEEYIAEDLGQKVDIIQLALSDPGLVGNILVQYAHDRPWASGTALGALAAGILNPGKGAKVLIGIAKNLPKVGTKVTTSTLKMVQPTIVGAQTAAAKATAVAAKATKLEEGAKNAADVAKLKSDLVTKSADDLETFKTQATAVRTAANTAGPTSPNATQLTKAADDAEELLRIQTNEHTAAMAVAKQAKENAERLAKLAETEKKAAQLAADEAVLATQPKNIIASTKSHTNYNALAGVGDSFGRTAVGVGIGAGVAYSLQNQYEILGSGDFNAELFASNSILNPSGTNQPTVSLQPPNRSNLNNSINGWLNAPEQSPIQNINGSNINNSINGLLKNNLPTINTGDTGPLGTIVGRILNTESRGGDPNAFWGDRSGKYNHLLNGKQISQMTFKELKEFQKNLIGATRNAPGANGGTSAAGIGQWVGTTLFGKGFNNTGFLKDYFQGENYDEKIFDLDRQKDMFKSYLKSKKYGNLEGFMENPRMSVDAYAKHLGKQWEGVGSKHPQEQAKLKAALTELRKTPDLNVDDALNKIMASMNNLSEKTGDFKKSFNGVADQITDAFSSIKDFLSDVTNKAGELLPKEFKDLFDMPAMKEFLDPFLGGESKSTLAHPKRTFTSLESQELRNLLMGTSEGPENENTESSDVKTYPYDRTKISIVPTPSISGEELAASSSALKSAEQRASQQQLGAVINTTSGNGGEAIHGQQIAGLSGNIDTHFPGDIDAISARIYQWTDAPMFYAAGRMV